MLLVLDGLGWEQLAGPPPPGADAGGHGRRADHHRRAVHDRHRAHLDHHRPAAGRARRRRLPDRTSTARSSTCCAGRTPAATPASAIPPDEFQPHAAVPAATARRSSPRPSSRRPASPRPTSPGSASTATGCRRRWSPRCGGCCRRGEPFVYAYYDGIDKVAHEYGLGEHYDAELAAADRLVADMLAVAAARRRAGRHRRPRPGRRGRRRRRRSHAEVLDPRVAAVGRGPLPLAARPPGPGDALAGGGAAPRHGDRRLGAHPSTRSSTRAGSGPRLTDDGAPPAGRRRPRRPRRRRVPRSRRHRARSCWSAGTGRSPPAEMLVPLLRRDADAARS